MHREWNTILCGGRRESLVIMCGEKDGIDMSETMAFDQFALSVT